MTKNYQDRFKISNEYLRGLVEGEGSFTFCTNGRFKIPTFEIQMNERDKELILTLCNRLRLPNEVYEYRARNSKDGYKRSPTVRLIVRELKSLKDIIIPFFYKKLKGHKGVQFDAWLETIGSDPAVSKKFKEIYHLYKSGYYEAYPKEKFWESKKEYLVIE